MTWILTALGVAGKLAKAGLRAIAAYPWQAAVIALALACAWMWTGWSDAEADLRDCVEAREADRRAYVKAQQEAAAKARAARLAKEQEYRDHAKQIDQEHAAELDEAHRRAADYIRTHRVPARPSSETGRPGTGTGDSDTGVPEGTAPGPVMVEVSEADIEACTGATVYARQAYEWARGLDGTP